jgi:hypothetical protein
LQAFVDAPYAAYLMRQHMASSLYDRLSTRPFLTHIEKVCRVQRFPLHRCSSDQL